MSDAHLSTFAACCEFIVDTDAHVLRVACLLCICLLLCVGWFVKVCLLFFFFYVMRTVSDGIDFEGMLTYAHRYEAMLTYADVRTQV
jgi:hypothetical protein